MMMGTEWLVWVIVAVVLFRLVARGGRWRRGWWWYDDWLDNPAGRDRLPGRGTPGRDGNGHGRKAGAYPLERRRAALEEAADRLEEASARLRRKAWRGGPTTDGRRPAMGSSASSGPGRIARSPDPSGSEPTARTRVPARKPAETRLAVLQRRFAEGRITMEQYERELDKLYGLT